MARNWRQLPLDEANQAMLAYVEIVAMNPSAATAAHLADLRCASFGDAEIFEIVMVTAYDALRCRMADALGVEVDLRSQQDVGDHFVQEVSPDAIGRILAEWIPTLG